VTLTEIATHKANELRLLHLAMHDALTGLPNRDAFVERVDVSLTRAARDHVTALLFVDLDGFKQVNDSYGHRCGDTLLTSVARRIRSTLRPFDTLGRLGGDEFAIVCEVASGHDATKLAQRIVDAVACPFEIDDENIMVGASIGVATASPETTTSDQLIAAADEAMYRAKQAGGAQWWMPGARDVEVRTRRARADAEAAIAQLMTDVARLQQRCSELHSDTVHLGDEPLTRRVAGIAAALEQALHVADCRSRR
jgi:diguanylate cyclase (GGDEF)-like protein